MAKTKKPRFYVDRHPEQENDFHRNCPGCFQPFRKYQDAADYAAKYGDPELGPLPILDKHGEPAQTPKTVEQLEQALTDATEAADAAARNHHREMEQAMQREYELKANLINAGLIPLLDLRGRIEPDSLHVDRGVYEGGGARYHFALNLRPGDSLGSEIVTAIINNGR